MATKFVDSNGNFSAIDMDRSGLISPPPHLLVKRKRRQFGRPWSFLDKDGQAIDVPPDAALAAEFRVKVKCKVETQLATQISEHEVNNDRVITENSGVNHQEGGWPKDISYLDLEQTMRFRKKTEKDDIYIQTIHRLGNVVEHGIQQNNALNIYQRYFMPSVEPEASGPHSFKLLSVLREPLASGRAVTGISWTSSKKLAIACSTLCDPSPSARTEDCTKAFVWDVGESPVPEVGLWCPSSAVCIEFNPKDPHVIVGGCIAGQVVYWDVRRPQPAVGFSSEEVGHRDCVRSILWLNSKTGTDFFSASIDGEIVWWDIRKLSQPTDSLILDPTRGLEMASGRPIGATFLEFEPTMSTKFMVGTELGTVFLCNSKAKSIQEKLGQMYMAHLGSIQALQRNPMFPKNFLTVGDWSAKIWSEDVRESPIAWSGYGRTQLTAGCWSPARPSIYFTANIDGNLALWDLLVDRQNPLYRAKVSNHPLCSIKVHDSGRLVACGALDGSLALTELGEELAVLTKNDKSLLTALFDRETKRERILESRSREQRLREKAPGNKETDYMNLLSERNAAIETQYREALKKEVESA